MEAFRDYLGWDYSNLVSYLLLMVWAMAIWLAGRKAKVNAKTKQKKKSVYKMWWVWPLSLLVLSHFLLTNYGTYYFGLGTPDSFSEIHITADEIILFDNETEYYDDDNTNNENYASHLRIHVVDRLTHQKKYEDLIGTNYSTHVDSNGIYIVGNTSFYYSSSDNVVQSIRQYNTATQEMTTLVENDGSIKVEGKDIEVYEISVLLAIIVTSKKGDQYIYNSSAGVFEEFDGTYDLPVTDNSNNNIFYLVPEFAGSEKKILQINQVKTRHDFLKAEILNSFYFENESFVLIKSNEDLTSEESVYTFINGKGQFLWDLKITDLEKEVNDNSFEALNLIELYEDVLYITSEEYLFEIDCQSGDINWWLKL